ncbi:MAG TPA: GNAT family N-acetyltransferase [Stellaceae bacterium]|nr:GNAT family N-acetyltransferase [Stellaceae bacterium]
MSPPAGSPVSFVIRDSEPGDIPAITAIYGHSVITSLATFDETAPSCEEMAQRRAEVLEAGLPFIVAVKDDGRLVGYAYAGAFRRRTGYRYTLEDSIYVERNATHRGIGTALLTELIDRCGAAGYRQMVAVIADTERTASIGLHEKLGFRTVGTLPAIGFKFGRWIDVVLMQRALGPDGIGTPRR